MNKKTSPSVVERHYPIAAWIGAEISVGRATSLWHIVDAIDLSTEDDPEQPNGLRALFIRSEDELPLFIDEKDVFQSPHLRKVVIRRGNPEVVADIYVRYPTTNGSSILLSLASLNPDKEEMSFSF